MIKVLLLEDDVVLTEMYLDKFKHEKCEVKTAKDGQEGLTILQSFTPDIILLDLIMPNMSGFDFLKALRKDPKFTSIPVLVLTNIYADAEDLVKNYRVAGVMLKANSTPEQILEKILSVISTHTALK
jgi:adenylate cyclase